jgi:hypothetical protein
MHRWISLPICLLIFTCIASAQSEPQKQHSSVPAQLVKARWVFLTSYTADGSNFLARPDPADLAAIVDVRKRLHDWGYYKEVASPEMADLVIAIRRKENSLGTRAGTSIDLSTAGRVNVTEPRSAMGGPTEDAMSVFGGSHGADGVVIWKRMMKDGLHTPKLALVMEFRKFVESAKP